MGFNERKKDLYSEGFSEAVAEGITTAMKPVFENLTSEIHQMMINMENKQEADMRRMADAFLEEMRRSSDKMFEDVTKKLTYTCEMQAKITQRIGVIVESVSKDCLLLYDASSNMVNVAEDMKKIQVNINQSLANQTSKIDGIAGQMSSFMKSSVKSSNEMIECQKMLDETAENMAQSVKEATDRIGSYSEKISNVSGELNDGMDETFKEFDTQMARIVGMLSEAAEEISEVTKQIPRTLKGSIDELERTIRG